MVVVVVMRHQMSQSMQETAQPTASHVQDESGRADEGSPRESVKPVRPVPSKS